VLTFIFLNFKDISCTFNNSNADAPQLSVKKKPKIEEIVGGKTNK